MVKDKTGEIESADTMRPVAVWFFSATLAIAVFLTGTATMAVSPLTDTSVQFAAR
jgi:hypothetical protein